MKTFEEVQGFALSLTGAKTEQEMVENYKKISILLKTLEMEKDTIRDLLPVGHYSFDGVEATVSEYSVRRVNTRKLFSHLLRKGKMSTFLDAATVSMKALEEGGINPIDYNRFTEPSRSFKQIRVK